MGRDQRPYSGDDQNEACGYEGDAIAIRVWPKGGVSIETQWDLHLGIDIAESAQDQLPRKLDQSIRLGAPVDAILFRAPNAATASWVSAEQVPSREANAIQVRTLERSGGLLLIEVDGVRMVVVPSVVDGDFVLPTIDGVDVIIHQR